MSKPKSTSGFLARLQSLRSGDHDARNDIVESMLPQIEAYVRLNAGKRMRARESCSDLVQTICREALQDADQFRGSAEAQFRSWLFRLAQRKIQSRFRAQHAKRRDIDRDVPLEVTDAAGQRRLLTTYCTLTTPSINASAREELARIEGAIEQLPDDQRRVLTMARILGLNHREIAEELGKEETAVRKILSRARARLALLLALTAEE